MTAVALAAVAVLALSMALPLYRAVAGPTYFDRLIGLGLIGTKTTVMLVAIGVALGRADLFVDIALSYALVSFIGTVALAKYFESRGGAR